MVKPTDIKKYLSQAYFKSKRLEKLNEQIGFYRAKAMKQTSAWSDSPSGGVSTTSPQAVFIEKLMLLTDELNEEAIRMLEFEKEARKLINLLDSEREKMFLEDYHVNKMTMEKIALQRHYSERQVYRVMGDAYRKLSDIVNEDEELERRILEVI